MCSFLASSICSWSCRLRSRAEVTCTDPRRVTELLHRDSASHAGGEVAWLSPSHELHQGSSHSEGLGPRQEMLIGHGWRKVDILGHS